jgi:hypothetical protein
MSYTNTWSTTRPLGSAQAATADDEIRTLRLDITERMNSIVTDWAADPVVMRPDALSRLVTRSICLHGSAFVSTEDDDDVTWFDQYVQSDNSGDRIMKAAIPVPSGVTIIGATFLWSKQTLNGVVGQLIKESFDTTHATTVVGSVTNTANGVQESSIGTVSELVATDGMYFFKVSPADLVILDRIVIYGARIFYTESGFIV